LLTDEEFLQKRPALLDALEKAPFSADHRRCRYVISPGVQDALRAHV